MQQTAEGHTPSLWSPTAMFHRWFGGSSSSTANAPKASQDATYGATKPVNIFREASPSTIREAWANSLPSDTSFAQNPPQRHTTPPASQLIAPTKQPDASYESPHLSQRNLLSGGESLSKPPHPSLQHGASLKQFSIASALPKSTITAQSPLLEGNQDHSFYKQHAAASVTSASEFFTKEPSVLLAVHGKDLSSIPEAYLLSKRASSSQPARYKRSIHRMLYDVDMPVVEDTEKKFDQSCRISPTSSRLRNEELDSYKPTSSLSSLVSQEILKENNVDVRHLKRPNRISTLQSDSFSEEKNSAFSALHSDLNAPVLLKGEPSKAKVGDAHESWFVKSSSPLLSLKDSYCKLARNWSSVYEIPYSAGAFQGIREGTNRDAVFNDEFQSPSDAVDLYRNETLPYAPASHSMAPLSVNSVNDRSSEMHERLGNQNLSMLSNKYVQDDFLRPQLTGMGDSNILAAPVHASTNMQFYSSNKEALAFSWPLPQKIHNKATMQKRLDFFTIRLRNSLQSIVDSFLSSNSESDMTQPTRTKEQPLHLESIFWFYHKFSLPHTEREQSNSIVEGVDLNVQEFPKPHMCITHLNDKAGLFFLFNYRVFVATNALDHTVHRFNRLNHIGEIAGLFFEDHSHSSRSILSGMTYDAQAMLDGSKSSRESADSYGRVHKEGHDYHQKITEESGEAYLAKCFDVDASLLSDLQSLFPACSPTNTCIDRFISMLNDLEIMFSEKPEELVYKNNGEKLAIVSCLPTMCYPVWEITNFYSFLESEGSILRELAWHLESVSDRLSWGAAEKAYVILPIYGRQISFATVFAINAAQDRTYAVYSLSRFGSVPEIASSTRKNASDDGLMLIEKRICAFSDVVATIVVPYLSLHAQQAQFLRTALKEDHSTVLRSYENSSCKSSNELSDPGVNLMCFIDSFYCGFNFKDLGASCTYSLRFLYLQRLLEFCCYKSSYFHKFNGS